MGRLALWLDYGDRAEGKVTVVPEDINFIIKGPEGETVLNAGRVTEKSFAFVAPTTGTYQFLFVSNSPTSTANNVILVQVQHPGGARFPYFAGIYVPVNAGQAKTITLMLAANQGLKGSFKIQGGQQDLMLYVSDPSGKRPVSGKIYGSNTFGFRAAASGAYQLCFDNGFSRYSSKLVSLELYTDPDGQWQSWWGAPTKLAFTAAPAGAVSGSAFTTQPVVTIQDGSGNTATTSSAAVTLTITAGTGTNGAMLSGTTTVSAVNGVATFSGLGIDLPGSGYTLTATSSGLLPATGSPFTVSSKSVPPQQLKMFTLSLVVMPATAGSITLSPNDGTYISGTTVTLTVVPALGYRFVEWGDNLLGTANPINIIMDSNKKVSAHFVPINW